MKSLWRREITSSVYIASAHTDKDATVNYALRWILLSRNSHAISDRIPNAQGCLPIDFLCLRPSLLQPWSATLLKCCHHVRIFTRSDNWQCHARSSCIMAQEQYTSSECPSLVKVQNLCQISERLCYKIRPICLTLGFVRRSFWHTRQMIRHKIKAPSGPSAPVESSKYVYWL